MIELVKNFISKPVYFKNKEVLLSVLEEIEKSIDYDKLVKNLPKRIRNYFFIKAKKEKAVIGISGGIDSSVAVALLSEAIGSENVYPLFLPHNKNVNFEKNVDELVEHLKLKNYTYIYIGDLVAAIINTLNNSYPHNIRIDATDIDINTKIRIGNIASRLRVNIFYDLSKAIDGLVICTGIKPDFLLGYLAKYGTPFSCDFGFLRDLYKIDIYNIAYRLNIPNSILFTTPSTGYYPEQTHEKEIGIPLFELDAILFLKYEKKLSNKHIYKNFLASYDIIKKVEYMYEKSKHKRFFNLPFLRIRRK